MAEQWTLTLAELPPGPNDRLHYQERARHTRGYRAWAYYAAKQAGIPPLGQVRLSAVVQRRRLGMADEDNDRARLKPLVDGLVDAGVIPNDTRDHVRWGAVDEEHGAPCVRLIVEALP